MKVDLYDKVLLKDGRKAIITDKLGFDFVADIEIGNNYDTQLIENEQIEKVLR